MLTPIKINIKVYMVRSQDGKWFRAKGLGGSGDSWVSDVKKARVYTKIGPARSCVTWWTNNYPEYGSPDVVEIPAEYGYILDEKTRIQKNIEKKEEQIRQSELKKQQKKLTDAQAAYKLAKKALEDLGAAF